jgi:hypothetical protein
MMNMSRRSMLRGATMAALATSLGCASAAAAQGLRPSGGCFLCQMARLRLGPDASGIFTSSPGNIAITRTSGDAGTDHFLGLALKRLATTFHVSPGFAFYDDARAPNAVATDKTLAGNGPGTVLMGQRLFRMIMSATHDAGMTVIAICAHEFGHIHQYETGYRERLQRLDSTAKPLELHADFLAGFFLALRKAEHPDLDLQTVGRFFNMMGDTDFTNPQHHGTPQERIAAIEAGFNFGKGGKGDVAQAAAAGTRFVSRVG